MYLIHAQFDCQFLEHIHDDRSQPLPLVLRLHLDLVAAIDTLIQINYCVHLSSFSLSSL